MNIRKAKKLIKRVKDINTLPLNILRAPSVGIQHLLETTDYSLGIIEYNRYGIDRYYTISPSTSIYCEYLDYERKWEHDGEPELDWYEHGYWDTELGLPEGPDYFHTGPGRTVLISAPYNVYRRQLLKKEFDWLMENLEKYREVRPGISVYKEETAV